MSSRRHINTRRNVPDFSSHSLDLRTGFGRSKRSTGNLYFGFRNQPVLGPFPNTVVVNRSLLEPLQLSLDPNVHATKVQEKEQIKSLNNRFVSFIEKVRYLEQQNKQLETKLQVLQSGPQTEVDIESMFKMHINKLRSQLNTLQNSTEHLKRDLQNTLSLVEENKYKYEQELDRRYTAENDFVCMKKDSDDGSFDIIKLKGELSEIKTYLDFFKALYAEELRELNEQQKKTSCVVEMDNSRQLNMEQVVKEAKSQYEDIFTNSQQEVEACCKKKFELVSFQDEEYKSDLRHTKHKVSDMKRMIKKLQSDITAVTEMCKSLEGQVVEAERCGDEAVHDAQKQIKDLGKAMQNSKQDMGRQVHEYQQLMNIKLALDIEIATYKKLLEGEENRIGQDSVVRVQTKPHTHHSEPVTTITSTCVIFKVIDTEDTD